MTIKLSKEVFEGIEEVRQSGLTNMLDRSIVIQLCEKFGYPESASWIKEHKSEYIRLVFEGPEVES